MPLFDLFWAMLWFFLWIAWFWILITVFADIFRSDDLSGWGKAAWTLVTVFLPYLGVFVYLIARGSAMTERSHHQAMQIEATQRAYIKSVAASGSTTDELERLARLRDSGALSEDEFQAMKAKLLV